jgi:hypothetical protein
MRQRWKQPPVAHWQQQQCAQHTSQRRELTHAVLLSKSASSRRSAGGR